MFAAFDTADPGLTPVVDAPLTADLPFELVVVFELEDFDLALLAVITCLITLALPAVAWLVQNHLPFASAHVSPSLAVP